MNKARALVVVVGVGLFFCAIVFRLYDIQISQHENYKFLAERQQKKTKELIAERGSILDAKGEVLVYTKEAVSFYIYKKNITDKLKDKLVKKFVSVFKKPASYYLNIFENGRGDICIEKKVPKEIAEKLKDLLVDGLAIREDNIRIYPYENLASHIIGYVNTEFRGVNGVERVCNEYLSGRDGELLIERDVRGRTVAIDGESTVNAQDGFDVELTIQKRFQKILEEELKSGVEGFEANSAIGIVMNPNNGEIMALANYPDFNPQKYNEANDEQRRNRAITDIYEPGSTMKSIILSTLIEEKKARPAEVINTESYVLNGRAISDEHKYPSLTVAEILEHSSNIGMARLSDRLDVNTFYKYLRDFGFGNYTSLELPGEVNGKLIKPSLLSRIAKASMSRGYAIDVTPVQMTAAYSAVVNGGVLYKPQLIKAIKDKQGNYVREFKNLQVRRVISENTSGIMRHMMMGVVENGTGRMACLDDVTVGGKTGTAKKIINGKYSDKYNSSFIGFFPVEKPQVVCYIMVDNPKKGKYGGSSAAPIFKNIAKRMIESEMELAPVRKQIKRKNTELDMYFAEAAQSDDDISFANIEENDEETVAVKQTRKTVPNLIGKSAREAVSLLSGLGMEYKINGSGKVIKQSIEAGTIAEKNKKIVIECNSVNKIKNLRLN